MDLLLGRLSGLRTQWERERMGLVAQVGRGTSRVSFSLEDGDTVVDITSEFGIDTATITRKSASWPKSIVVRLHLAGLESFKARGKRATVEWSVSSTGDHSTRTSLWKGRDESAMPANSPYRTDVRIVGGDGKIPLRGGYFQVPLPAKLFEDNPDRITLQWIDFYRG
jgi:hypothetical protein